MKRLDNIQYHYNVKYDMIFFTAESILSRKRSSENVGDIEKMELDAKEDLNMPSTSGAASTAANQLVCDPESRTEHLHAGMNVQHANTSEEPQTNIYLPHIASNDLNLLQLSDIQTELFEWSQQLEKPPKIEHIVLAIVDPSFTIIYYKVTKGMLDLP